MTYQDKVSKQEEWHQQKFNEGINLMKEMVLETKTPDQLMQLIELYGWFGVNGFTSIDELKAVTDFFYISVDHKKRQINMVILSDNKGNTDLFNISVDDIIAIKSQVQDNMYEITIHLKGSQKIVLATNFKGTKEVPIGFTTTMGTAHEEIYKSITNQLGRNKRANRIFTNIKKDIEASWKLGCVTKERGENLMEYPELEDFLSTLHKETPKELFPAFYSAYCVGWHTFMEGA